MDRKKPSRGTRSEPVYQHITYNKTKRIAENLTASNPFHAEISPAMLGIEADHDKNKPKGGINNE